MMAPPTMVTHYTWNGMQYPSMEIALNAMMVEACRFQGRSRGKELNDIIDTLNCAVAMF